MQPTVEIVTVASADGDPEEVYLCATRRDGDDNAAATTNLRWDRCAQRFVESGPFRERWGSDNAMGSTADGDGQVAAVTSTAVGCHGVFGVLPLGAYDASIIYITEVRPVKTNSRDNRGADLVLPGGHGVMEILKMQHLPLPSKPFHTTSSLPSPTPSPIHPPQPRNDTPQAPSASVDPPPVEPDDPTEMPMNRKTLAEYRKLLSRFVMCQSFEDGVHLYYSPTCTGLGSDDVAAALQGVVSDRRLRLESTFRWNAALLHAFYGPVPTPSSSCNTPPVRHKGLMGSRQPSGACDPVHVCDVFVPCVFRGYVGSAVVVGPPQHSSAAERSKFEIRAALITRLSCVRAGTRYNRRGLDAISGMTANFSETTQLVYTASRVALYTIVRGSIPLCWSQPPNLTFKPTITLSPREHCQREVHTHLKALADLYGSLPVHCVDATSRSRLEWPLSEAYASSFLSSGTPTPVPQSGGSMTPSSLAVDARYTKFDIGDAMKSIGSYGAIQEQLVELVCGGGARDGGFDSAVFRLAGAPVGGSTVWSSCEPVRAQHVLYRVNCLDCLDRANMVQSMLCLHAGATSQLPAVLEADNAPNGAAACVAPQLAAALRPLWAANGTALSGLYAGSRPHFLDLLLHGRRSHALVHWWTSGCIALKRFVQQNFCDGRKQDVVSLVTREHSAVARANPFERRMTYYNLMVAAALGMATVVLGANTVVMVVYERYRFRADFLLFQCLWIGLLLVVALRIRKDPSLLVSFPVLK